MVSNGHYSTYLSVFEVLNVKTLLFKWSKSSGTISITGEMGNKYGRSSLCSSLMHFAANRYSSPLLVSGGMVQYSLYVLGR